MEKRQRDRQMEMETKERYYDRETDGKETETDRWKRRQKKYIMTER
jgi:hypothetical protein